MQSDYITRTTLLGGSRVLAHAPGKAAAAPDAHVHVILNPAAGAGKARLLEQPILHTLASYGLGKVVLHRTSGTLSATAAAREAVNKGVHTLIAVGGDGTINEVVNGMFSASVSPEEVSLGIINAGTGRGFANGMGLPPSLAGQLDVIAAGVTRPVDIARLDYSSPYAWRHASRFFVNECQVGIGAAVVRRNIPTRSLSNG